MTDTLTANEQTAVDFFATLGSGDLAKLKTFFTADSVWTVVAKSIPGSGSHKGPVGIADEFLAPVRGMFVDGDPKLPITNVFSKGKMVAVETHTQGTLKSGKKYDNKYCWILEVVDGKVLAVREYMDGGYVATLM